MVPHSTVYNASYDLALHQIYSLFILDHKICGFSFIQKPSVWTLFSDSKVNLANLG